MSQNDPRGNLAAFGDFGVYFDASDNSQTCTGIFDSFRGHGHSEVGVPGGESVLTFSTQGLPGADSGVGGLIASNVADNVINFGCSLKLLEHNFVFDEGPDSSVDPQIRFTGWGRTGSLARTYDGYQAIPTGFNAIHSYIGPMARLFFGPGWGQYVTRANLPYQNLEGTIKVPVDYEWACPPSSGLPDQLLPFFYTDDTAIGFNSIYDRTQELHSSFATLLGRVYQASGAILQILSGGTLANYGSSSDTSSRVVSAVQSAIIETDEGETLSVSDRLARIESTVSQLIALTTYSYYVSGASIDSTSGSSVAEGVLDYLKTFLGSGVASEGGGEENGNAGD